MTTKPKVLIAVPNTGMIHESLVSMLIRMHADERVSGMIVLSHMKPIEQNMTWCAQMALKRECDYMISIDHDNTPTRNPLDLVFLDKDVVGCPTPMYERNADVIRSYTNVFERDEGKWKAKIDHGDGLEEVDAVGFGCIVIAARVLKTVRAPFMRKWDDDGFQAAGLDVNFCQRAKAEGFGIWAHWGYMCHHYKWTDVLELENATWKI